MVANTLEILVDVGYKNFTENEVKSALEKQIPKKPIEKEFVEDVSLNYCPCCNVRFIGWGMKFCGECGQALDWSDTE